MTPYAPLKGRGRTAAQERGEEAWRGRRGASGEGGIEVTWICELVNMFTTSQFHP